MVYAVLIFLSIAVPDFGEQADRNLPKAPSAYVFAEKQVAGNETKKVILQKALETLKERFDPDKYRFRLSARWIPGSLLRVEPERIRSVEVVRGVDRYTNFDVVVRNGSHRQHTQIQLAVHIEQKLPVLTRRIGKGEVLQAGDLAIQWVVVRHNRQELITETQSLIGKTLTKSMLPGQPVRHSEVSGRYLIEAGDLVQLIFKSGGFRIELTGEARQSGAKNDEIRIYSKETRKKYVGKVIAPGVAKWQKTLY